MRIAGERRLLGRLRMNSCPRRSAGPNFTRHDQREVPRHDRTDHADRLARDQRERVVPVGATSS